MAMIPVRFKRITAALDDDARARLCESSGSEHSANTMTDLSDLLDSFFDGDDDDRRESIVESKEMLVDCEEETEYRNTEGFCGVDCDVKEMLVDLIGVVGGGGDGDGGDHELEVRSEVEAVCRRFESSSSSSSGFKRRLMTVLRQRGFDAGLCKSRWEKTGRHPSGEHEYIDVLISGNRYIVEPSLISEFTIARPTKTYQSLLDTLPNITVIKPNNLKNIIRLMCAAMRESLKARDMVVSPWRRNGYMQSKWFGPYKRTTIPVPLKSTAVNGGGGGGGGGFEGERFLGFECLATVVGDESSCRKEVGRMHVGVVGNLKVLMLSGRS